MPQYTVEKELWLGGLKQPVGKVVNITEGQAKYLGHALTKIEEKTAPAAKKAKGSAAPAAGTVVTEAPANGAGN